MTEEAVRYTHMQFLVRDPEDILAPGIQLKAYTNVVAVPREYEVIRVNGQKYQIVEGGVLWNFVYEGILVTVIVEKRPE
uniref:Uncharacterized protein n=1 Tax=viral metagenome TaxID=1070528 RepID=A0A6M3LUL6_9ZZZZ